MDFDNEKKQKFEFIAMVEILGKPEEHVKGMLDKMLQKMKNDENLKVKVDSIGECKKQENAELWATFAEVEVEVENVAEITSFCFDYMPSSLQITSPQNLKFGQKEFTDFLNDLQAKLHQVDMVAKQMKVQRDSSNKNMVALLKNYILVLLNKNKMSLEQLSGFTGVQKEKLGDYMDRLIDEGKVDLEGELYFRVNPT